MSFRNSTIAAILLILTIVFSYSDVFTNEVQPVAGRTGAPSETTCGTSACHNTTPNTFTGNVTITFSDPNLKYIPGDTYDVTVTVTEASITEWGFELTALDAANALTPGTFLAEKNGVITSSPISGTFPNRKYRAHKNADGNNTWTFPWIAPSTNIGCITFYAAGNASNDNNALTGDHIYTSSLEICADSTNGIFSSSNNEGSFNIQSLVYNQITVEYNHSGIEPVRFSLYDMNGKLLQTLLDENSLQGKQVNTFKLANTIGSGMFLINYSSAEQSITKKIFIQK